MTSEEMRKHGGITKTKASPSALRTIDGSCHSSFDTTIVVCHSAPDRSSPRKVLLRWSKPICLREGADSFFEKKPTKCRSPDVEGWCRYEAFDAGTLASACRLAQAQFSHQRPDPFAFRQTHRRLRVAAISEDPRRRDLHHVDRALLVSRSDSRRQCLDRPNLVKMAQGDQETQATRL